MEKRGRRRPAKTEDIEISNKSPPARKESYAPVLKSYASTLPPDRATRQQKPVDQAAARVAEYTNPGDLRSCRVETRVVETKRNETKQRTRCQSVSV